jgi:LysM repeat protein
VQAGDTLFSIARRFGMTVDELKLQNRLSGNGLQVGQTLRIDPGQSGIATAPLMVRVRAPAATPRIYTVRAGDSLFAIALKFGVDLDDLMRWNKLTGRTVIQPGLKIRVTS